MVHEVFGGNGPAEALDLGHSVRAWENDSERHAFPYATRGLLIVLDKTANRVQHETQDIPQTLGTCQAPLVSLICISNLQNLQGS